MQQTYTQYFLLQKMHIGINEMNIRNPTTMRETEIAGKLSSVLEIFVVFAARK